MIDRVSFRAFVAATEDEIRVREALSVFVPLDRITRTAALGHFGNEIAILDAALRKCFHLDGWVALKQLECNTKGLFILVTLPQNAEALKPTGFTVCAGIEEALSIAYAKCGTRTPRVTVMPRASLTLPILPENHA